MKIHKETTWQNLEIMYRSEIHTIEKLQKNVRSGKNNCPYHLWKLCKVQFMRSPKMVMKNMEVIEIKGNTPKDEHHHQCKAGMGSITNPGDKRFGNK